MKKKGSVHFFKADEIEELIYYFLEKNDVKNLNKAIEIGLSIYPNDTGIKVAVCETLFSLNDFESALEKLDDPDLQDDIDADMLRLDFY
jgi:hypothetical protein